MAKRCCYPECEEEMSGTFVACMKHWKLVPKEVRCEIQKRRRAWKNEAGHTGNLATARDYLITWFKNSIRRQTHESC